jgi:hypothetical protein
MRQLCGKGLAERVLLRNVVFNMAFVKLLAAAERALLAKIRGSGRYVRC